jgi:hypothetical protein
MHLRKKKSELVLQILKTAARSKFRAFQDEEEEEGSQPSLMRRHRYLRQNAGNSTVVHC